MACVKPTTTRHALAATVVRTAACPLNNDNGYKNDVNGSDSVNSHWSSNNYTADETYCGRLLTLQLLLLKWHSTPKTTQPIKLDATEKE